MRVVSSLLVLASLQTLVSGAKVQKSNLRLPASARQHRDAVEKIFTTSYEAYLKYAYPHDDLQPVTLTYNDGRNGWGASVVDAMATMYIMGLDDLFKDAVNFTASIDFSKSQTPDTVSVFETTIRYLGGLLSAYELSGQKYPILLKKATEIADKMAYAWVGDNDVPFGFLDFTDNSPTIDTSNIAEAGTLSLEWATLTKHTGNSTYRQLVEKSVKHIANLAAPLPGLAAQGIDPATGEFVGGYVTWGGGSDSYFEYLIKFPRLFTDADPIYANTWLTAVDSSIKYLLTTSTVGNWTYLTDYDTLKRTRYVGSHLACFHGGNWIFGGKLLNNQTIVDIGLKLTDACWNTYAGTETGLGPEVFAYISPNGNFTGYANATDDQLAFYNEHGFYITEAYYYYMRPEVLESNFYAYRATGDQKYLDRAAAAIDSINKYLTTTVAYAGIEDVNDTNSDKIDDMQSFWLAEVLKYLYLTFDDPNHINLDEWVFNTEAQPFKAPSIRGSYGSGPAKGHGGFHARPGPPLPQISPNPFTGPLKISDPF